MDWSIRELDGGNLVGFIDGNVIQVSHKHPQIEMLKQAILSDDPEGFLKIYDQGVKTVSCRTDEIAEPLKVEEETIEYRGNTISDPVIIKIIKGYGPSCDAMKKFVDNLFLNPSWESVKQLGSFLQHGGFPLTEDGCFIGYRAVQNDYTDKHTGTMDNRPGCEVKMPRREVAFNPEEACSAGLHVGTYSYASTFANSDDKIIAVKVNPAHCVSVPHDADCQKLRCSQFLVLADCKSLLDTTIIYSFDGSQISEKNYFADIRNSEEYRCRRPKYTLPVTDTEEDYDEDDYEDDYDDYSFCDNCGAECLSYDYHFCPHCGSELE